MMVARIEHHYAMLIRGSNRRRFRIPEQFNALAERLLNVLAVAWGPRGTDSAGEIYNRPQIYSQIYQLYSLSIEAPSRWSSRCAGYQ